MVIKPIVTGSEQVLYLGSFVETGPHVSYAGLELAV